MAPAPPPRRLHLALLALGWTAFAVYGSLVPLRYQHVALADAFERFRNLPPLAFGVDTRADWIANVLLFIPLTFLWMGGVASGRGRTARLLAACLLLPGATTVAVALEFTQIWFAGRTVSRNDIVAEALGGAIGIILWFGVGERAVAWLDTFNTDRRSGSRLTWILAAYCVALFIYSVFPLDLTISLTELYHKYRRGRVVLVPFLSHDSFLALASSSLAVFVSFVPVGAWVAVTQGHRLRNYSDFVVGAVGGALIAAMIEIAQLLVVSRFTDVTDILLGTAGAGLGGWLIGRQGRVR